jgi:hypothetical protein
MTTKKAGWEPQQAGKTFILGFLAGFALFSVMWHQYLASAVPQLAVVKPPESGVTTCPTLSGSRSPSPCALRPQATSGKRPGSLQPSRGTAAW